MTLAPESSALGAMGHKVTCLGASLLCSTPCPHHPALRNTPNPTHCPPNAPKQHAHPLSAPEPSYTLPMPHVPIPPPHHLNIIVHTANRAASTSTATPAATSTPQAPQTYLNTMRDSSAHSCCSEVRKAEPVVDIMRMRENWLKMTPTYRFSRVKDPMKMKATNLGRRQV